MSPRGSTGLREGSSVSSSIILIKVNKQTEAARQLVDWSKYIYIWLSPSSYLLSGRLPAEISSSLTPRPIYLSATHTHTQPITTPRCCASMWPSLWSSAQPEQPLPGGHNALDNYKPKCAPAPVHGTVWIKRNTPDLAKHFPNITRMDFWFAFHICRRVLFSLFATATESCRFNYRACWVA